MFGLDSSNKESPSKWTYQLLRHIIQNKQTRATASIIKKAGKPSYYVHNALSMMAQGKTPEGCTWSEGSEGSEG